MDKPRLLDLFSGAGGSAKGYQRAGFYVIGVDIKPQPHYCGDEFHQADALEYLAEHGCEFDVIHASPPCQGYANVTRWRGKQSNHPRLIAPTRELLIKIGKPWVIENVRTIELNTWLMLCGSMFNLRVLRHRYFESPCLLPVLLPPCDHSNFLPFMHKDERAYADAMGCEWIDKVSARQAIPPAYCEWIGKQLMEQLR